MSRIGKMPISVPAGVEFKNDANYITVKGPKGEVSKQFSKELTIDFADGVITVTRPSDKKEHRSLHGLTRTLIANMVEGVTNGFSKTLEIDLFRCDSHQSSCHLLLDSPCFGLSAFTS